MRPDGGRDDEWPDPPDLRDDDDYGRPSPARNRNPLSVFGGDWVRGRPTGHTQVAIARPKPPTGVSNPAVRVDFGARDDGTGWWWSVDFANGGGNSGQSTGGLMDAVREAHEFVTQREGSTSQTPAPSVSEIPKDQRPDYVSDQLPVEWDQTYDGNDWFEWTRAPPTPSGLSKLGFERIPGNRTWLWWLVDTNGGVVDDGLDYLSYREAADDALRELSNRDTAVSPPTTSPRSSAGVTSSASSGGALWNFYPQTWRSAGGKGVRLRETLAQPWIDPHALRNDAVPAGVTGSDLIPIEAHYPERVGEYWWLTGSGASGSVTYVMPAGDQAPTTGFAATARVTPIGGWGEMHDHVVKFDLRNLNGGTPTERYPSALDAIEGLYDAADNAPLSRMARELQANYALYSEALFDRYQVGGWDTPTVPGWRRAWGTEYGPDHLQGEQAIHFEGQRHADGSAAAPWRPYVRVVLNYQDDPYGHFVELARERSDQAVWEPGKELGQGYYPEMRDALWAAHAFMEDTPNGQIGTTHLPRGWKP
jgi:hypothetical protein